MRILIADTYYTEYLGGLKLEREWSYAESLRRVLDLSFGTADFYSRNLALSGWECIDVIYNYEALQDKWAVENGAVGRDVFQAQVDFYQPDVLFFQDLAIPIPRGKFMVAAQCSCKLPITDFSRINVIFTSFPHYVALLKNVGVNVVFNPLAFDPIVLDRTSQVTRNYDCVFVGGVGSPSHWRRGMETLNAVAAAIPNFRWWGYGADVLPYGRLRDTYQGEAWGNQMYQIFRQAKIVINRHGEMSDGFANNMRLYEATGCGALLVTEKAPNLHDYFSDSECASYSSPADAALQVRYYLDNDERRRYMAGLGQTRTLREHTYSIRMKLVSDVLTGMLCHT